MTAIDEFCFILIDICWGTVNPCLGRARRLCTAACCRKCSSRRSILLANALPNSRGDNWSLHSEHTSTRACSVRRPFESLTFVKMRSAPPRREITAIDRALCRVVGIVRGQLQFAIYAYVDDFAKRFCPIRIEYSGENGAVRRH